MKRIIVALLAIVIAAVGLTAYGFYERGWDTPALRATALALHVPVARVGSYTIPYQSYRIHLDAEARFLAGPIAQAQGLSPIVTSEVRTRALERAMRIAAVDEMAAEQKIVVTPLDIERVFDGLVAQAASSTTPVEMHAFLQEAFGWTEADFKQQVLRPAMLEDVLRNKKFQATKDEGAFEKELQERLHRPDVKRYLKV